MARYSINTEPIQPAVSIIIPVFNREGLIVETLDSLTHQTFDDWEAIVVDDSSTDGTTAALPPVTFAGQLTANRVFGFNSQPEMLHWRLTSITSETGSIVAVTYTQPECTATNVPASRFSLGTA